MERINEDGEPQLGRAARIAVSVAGGLSVAGLVAGITWWADGWHHFFFGWIAAKLGVKAAVGAPVAFAAVAAWVRKRRSASAGEGGSEGA
ncbi:hypothetical protein [Streptomyces sp. NPDC002671]